MTPGDEAPAAPKDAWPDIEEGPRPNAQSYWVGLGLAILLTIASFAVAATHGVWAPSVPVLLAVVAIAQMGVHLVFFLHVSSSPDSTNTILALAFGIFVVALVVFGTMIIMENLDAQAVSMEELMRMQR
jgi:cytochrome o ubiquinol oxidase operon protein cyoD